MSYPGNPPDGSYPSSGAPQPGYPAPEQPNPYQQPATPVAPGYPFQPSAPPAPAPFGEAPVSGPGYPAGPPAPTQALPAQPQPPAYQPAYQPGVSSGAPAYSPGAAPAPGYDPAPAYPGSAAPVPGYDPAPAYPGGAVPGYDVNAPVSAPGYDPTGASAPPFNPYAPVPVLAPPRPKRSPVTLILAIATGVFFIATAVLAPLYIIKSNDYTKTTTAQRADIAAKQSQLADLNKQLKDKQAALDAANTKVKGTQDQLDEITAEKQAVAKCASALIAALAATTQSQFNTLITTADRACAAADQYLN